MTSFKRYTITAALPYANGPKHIGHLAGAYLPADIYARYLRSMGRDVVYVCGSDEHGTAIATQAIKEKTTPREIVDKYHVLVRDSFAELGISFDIYHRTSEPIHHETAQEFFLNLYNKGLLQEIVSDQYYDEEAKAFLADRYIQGTCPKCGNESAYGDQCEKCGTSLSPKELINPRSTLSGKQPVMKSTKHWYLPLDKYEDWLRKWILEDHKSDWKSNVYGQCKSWIDAGLQPRAVTRDLDWGVPVPVKDAEGKVLYVWFDAPIGYISATRQWAIDNNKDWELYWKDKETRLIHFIGKDNIVFHCIIFPVMLHAHGEYIVPDNVPSNEFMNLESDKMSTSRGWSIEMHEYIEDFPGKADSLRYYLTAIMPETRDSEFTWKGFQARNNNELVANLSNFVHRVMVLTQKYYDSKIPSADEYTRQDMLVLQEVPKFVERITNAIEEFRFREALDEVMKLSSHGNKYLGDTEPWQLIKTDEKRVRTIMNICAQICASLSIVLEPFLPFTAKTLADMLDLKGARWKDASRTDMLLADHQLKQAVMLHQKVEDDVIEKQMQKLIAKREKHQEAAVSKTAPAKAEVVYDDFMKMDIRVGTILEAERIPKADKLLKLLIDTGIDKRTVLSGIAEFYKPEDIIGQKVSILVNLAPRKIRGIESQGMILMSENSNGELSFVAPTKSDAENGGVIK